METTKECIVKLYTENGSYIGREELSEKELFKAETVRESIVMGLRLACASGSDDILILNEDGSIIYQRSLKNWTVGRLVPVN